MNAPVDPRMLAKTATDESYSRYLRESNERRLAVLRAQLARKEEDCAEMADDIWRKADAAHLPSNAWERDAMNYPEYVLRVNDCDALERQIKALS